MHSKGIRVISKSDIPEGGFAGIIETRMVMNTSLWPKAAERNDISRGFDDFIYLANGYFKPKDGAPMHPHADVDIVSVVLNGRIGHRGSLGDGTIIEGPGVQVQRAGAGIEHEEFNLDDSKTDIIQIWFRPPATGLDPAYQEFKLDENNLTTVLGDNDPKRFHSNMTCKIGFISKGDIIDIKGNFVALLTEGTAIANGTNVQANDLIEGDALTLEPSERVGLVLIQSNK